MEHTSSSCPRLGHTLRMQHSRNAFVAPQYIHCVCVWGVCVKCDSYSYSYNAHKACVDILLRSEQRQQRVGSYFCIPCTQPVG